jgi:hypothetical protein
VGHSFIHPPTPSPITEMANEPSLTTIQQRIWDGKLPLEVALDPAECRTFDDSDPYLVSVSLNGGALRDVLYLCLARETNQELR